MSSMFEVDEIGSEIQKTLKYNIILFETITGKYLLIICIFTLKKNIYSKDIL